MRGKSYLSEKEREEFFRRVKKLYKEERKSIRQNAGIPVDLMQARGEFLWELYGTDKVMLIDDKLISSIMKGSTEISKVILYFLCITNLMPDIPVESVPLKFSGKYAEVYNAAVNSGSHANPLLLPGLYRAWQEEDMVTYDSTPVAVNSAESSE